MSTEEEEVVGPLNLMGSGELLSEQLAAKIGEVLRKHPRWKVASVTINNNSSRHEPPSNCTMFITVHFTPK